MNPPIKMKAMKRFPEFGVARDSEGNQWELRWQRVEGDWISKGTRVLLRKPHTDTDTHYVDTRVPADRFKPDMIDGNFLPTKL